MYVCMYIYTYLKVGHVEGEGGKLAGIKNIFASRINGMLGLAAAFKRLDTSEGNYYVFIYEYVHI
jgi:hypothetical protein